MFCLNCGKEIPDNSAVCQFCGAVQPQAQQTPPQAPEQAPQQAFEQAPQQAPYSAPQQAPYGAPQQAPYGAPQQTPYGAPQQQSFPSFAPPTPTKKKNKAPMIIGIVVGVIILLAIIGAIAGSSDSSTNEGYAPVEAFGEYDINIESIPKDAVKAADVHVFQQGTPDEGITTLTYYCDGDEIKTWTEEFTMDLEDISLYTQEELDELIQLGEEELAKYEPYSFVETKVEIVDNTYIASCKFNDVTNHISDLKALDLLEQDTFTLYVSYDETRSNLILEGYTEVE